MSVFWEVWDVVLHEDFENGIKSLKKMSFWVFFLQKIDFYFNYKTKMNLLKMIDQNMSPFW
jgi:hypothetical protein